MVVVIILLMIIVIVMGVKVNKIHNQILRRIIILEVFKKVRVSWIKKIVRIVKVIINLYQIKIHRILI